jgi:ribonuclease P protein component
MSGRHTLDRAKRLRLKRDFDRVFRLRCSAANRFLLVYLAPNGLDGVRLAIQVSRRFGTAVRRNRAKRLIREVFRLEQGGLPTGFDLVCIPRPGTLGDWEQYRASLLRLSEEATKRFRKNLSKPQTPDRAT